MRELEKMIDYLGAELIEKAGILLYPVFLKFKDENEKLLIFYFHGLFSSESKEKMNHIDPQNNMTTDQFKSFIEYFLSNNYKFILHDEIKSDYNPGQRYAIITFDDGYFNNMLAIEILKQYKVPANIFMSTSHITENKSYWWDVIYKYRMKAGGNKDKIREEQTSLKGNKFDYIDNYILNNFGKNAFLPWDLI